MTLQRFRGSTVKKRWGAANEWLAFAKALDPASTIRGYYIQPKKKGADAELMVELDSDHVLSDTVEL